MKNLKNDIERDNVKFHAQSEEQKVEIGEMRAKIREYEKKNKDLNRMNYGLANDKDRVTREKKEAEHEKQITY